MGHRSRTFPNRCQGSPFSPFTLLTAALPRQPRFNSRPRKSRVLSEPHDGQRISVSHSCAHPRFFTNPTRPDSETLSEFFGREQD